MTSVVRRVRLPARGDVRRVLAFLGAHAVPGVEFWDGRRYARALRLPGGPAVLEATAARGTADVVWHLGDAGDEDAALAATTHLLGLGSDPAVAEQHLAADAVLAPLVARRPGLLTPGSADHGETLLRTIVGQQVSVAGARTVTGRLVAEHGERLETPVAGVTALFPTAQALASADPQTLPMPRARGRSVVAVAAALADDPDLPEDDAALLALPGVGPWTVAYTRLRTRADPDVFLPTDLGVRRQLEALGLPGDPRSARELSTAWAPYRTSALLHLWTALLDGRAAA